MYMYVCMYVHVCTYNSKLTTFLMTKILHATKIDVVTSGDIDPPI